MEFCRLLVQAAFLLFKNTLLFQDSETPCSFAEQGGKPVVLEWGTEGTLWDSEQLDEQRDVVRVGDSRLKENPKKPTDVKKVTKGELRKGRKKTKKKVKF